MKTAKLTLVSLTAAAMSAFFLSGCDSSKHLDPHAQWQTGDVSSAASVARQNLETGDMEKMFKTLDSDDEPLLWVLDAGLIAGINGEYETGTLFLDIAKGKIDEGYQQGEEKSAADTLLSLIIAGEYEPTAQEVIMVPVNQLYNALGGTDKSKVRNIALQIADVSAQVNEVQQRRILDRIEAAKKSNDFDLASPDSGELEGSKGSFSPAEEAQSSIDWSEVYPGGDFHLDFEHGAAASVFLNPFAYWLSGAVLMNAAENIGDVRDAKKRFEAAISLVGDGKSPFLESEFKLAAGAENSGDLQIAKNVALADAQNITYIIYEGGMAPKIGGDPVTVHVPKIVQTVATTLVAAVGKLGSAGVVIPTKGTAYVPSVESSGDIPELTVQGVTPETLIDYDATLKDLNETELPTVASGFILGVSAEYVKRSALLIATGLMLQEAAKKGGIALSLAKQGAEKVFESVAQPIELDKPDSRAWRFLPRGIGVAKLATPSDGQIDVAGEKIAVPATGVNFVRIRKASDTWPATVQVFPLAGESTAPVPVTRLGAPQVADAAE